MGHKGHFPLCVTGIKTALGTAQALNPLSGESVQKSRTVAGSSLESMPFSSRAICWLWKEGLGWLLWMLGPAKCSQQGGLLGTASGVPAPCREKPACSRDVWGGQGGSTAAPGHWLSSIWGPGRGSCDGGWAPGAQKGRNVQGSFWNARYSEADF